MNNRIIAVLGAWLTASASTAWACINDREVNRHEREFKSQYNAPAAPQTQPQTPAGPAELVSAPRPEPQSPPADGSRGVLLAGVGVGAGGAMLLGGFVLSLGAGRRKRDAA